MTHYYPEDTKFEDLVGKTIISFAGLDVSSGRVLLVCSDGTRYVMFHSQDCCENVSVEDIDGDPNDLIGNPVLYAYESVSSERPGDAPKPDYKDESETWTFYRIGTIAGSIVIRWLGESNGYYSESVNFELDRGDNE